MRTISVAAFLAFFLLACPERGFAQSGRIAPTGMVHLGRIDISEPQGPEDEGVIGFGAMASPQSFPSWLAWNLELMLWDFDHVQGPDATASSAVSEEVEVNVRLVNVGLAGFYPLLERVQVYGQVGVSYYNIEYRATGIDLIFFIPFPAEEEEEDIGTALTYGFGLMMWNTEKISLGLHARHYGIESSSEKFDIQDVNAGGEYIGLSIGMSF